MLMYYDMVTISQLQSIYILETNNPSCLKYAQLRTWNETVLSSEDKVSCSRIQMGLKLTPDMHRSIAN